MINVSKLNPVSGPEGFQTELTPLGKPCSIVRILEECKSHNASILNKEGIKKSKKKNKPAKQFSQSIFSTLHVVMATPASGSCIAPSTSLKNYELFYSILIGKDTNFYMSGLTIKLFFEMTGKCFSPKIYPRRQLSCRF